MTEILLVDDEVALRRPVARILERAGFLVTQCGEGGTALGLLAQRRFDVLVLDMHLPDMTGFTVLESIRQIALSVPPVVAITGDADHPRLQKAAELGVAAVIAKPFTLEELCSTVRRISEPAG